MRITQYDLAGPLSGSEYFVTVQDGKTKKVQATSFTPLFTGGCQCTLVSRGDSVAAPDVAAKEYLQSFQTKPNTLRTVGDWVEIISFGTFAVNSDVKNIFHEIDDGQVFHDFTTTGSITETVWELHSIMTKISDTQVKVKTTCTIGGTAISDGKTTNRYTSATVLTNQQVDVSVGSQNLSAAGDVTVEGFIIRLNQIDVNS